MLESLLRFLKSRAMQRIFAMRKSWLACVVAFVVALVTLGATGVALYFLTWPLVGAWYPAFATWSGDWVWGALAGTAIFWSVFFLVAGYVNQLLLERNQPLGQRRAVYVLILWAGAALLWWATLQGQFG